MKIALVVNTSWNIYNYRLGLVQEFLGKGIEVIVIAPLDDYSKKLVELGCTYYPISLEKKGSNPFNDFIFFIQLFKLYKKIGPDIILHFTIKPNIYGTLAARSIGIPSINNVSGLGTVFLHSNLTTFIAKILYKFSFKFPSKVFFQNLDDRELFIEKKLVKPSLTEILPGSGVNTKIFKPQESSRSLKFTFLMVSRLLYDKGIIEFIDAIKIVKGKEKYDVQFRVVGAIEEASNLGVSKTKIDEWVGEGLIEYFPFTDNLLDFYYQADCTVLPSYREGTPRSLLEAGACGKPLITTNVPGCKDVVLDNKNGFLCKVKDSKDLSVAMEKMLELSNEQYVEFSKNSRAYILTNFDEKLVINRYLDAIESIKLKSKKA